MSDTVLVLRVCAADGTLFADVEPAPGGLKENVRYRVAVDGGQPRFVEVEP